MLRFKCNVLKKLLSSYKTHLLYIKVVILFKMKRTIHYQHMSPRQLFWGRSTSVKAQCEITNVVDLQISYKFSLMQPVNCSRDAYACSVKTNYLRYVGAIRLLFLIGPLVYDWCVVQWGPKSKHYKGTCFEGDWTTPFDSTNYPTLNSEHKHEDGCIQLRNNKHALP